MSDFLPKRLMPSFIGGMIMLAYLAAGKAGLLLAYQHPNATPVWPPTGIAIAVLLIAGIRYWPAIAVAAFLANVTTAGSVFTSLGIATGNTLEGVVAAVLITKFCKGIKAFDAVNDVLLYAVVSLAAAAISSTVGVASLIAGGFADSASASGVWFTWWLGDAVGALTVAPLLCLWYRERSLRFTKLRLIEATVLCILLLGLGSVFFSRMWFLGPNHYPLAFLSLLPIFWAAVRFGPRETSTVTFLVAATAIGGTLVGSGPFVVESPAMSLALLQAFMGIAATMGLTLAAALVERRASEELLEAKVLARTRELEQNRDKDLANIHRLSATMLSLPMAALLMNERGDIIELNQAFCDLFSIGLPPEQAKKDNDELLKRFCASVLDPDTHMRKVRTALERRESIMNEEIILRDGRVVLRDLIFIFEGGNYRGQLFLYADVTQERQSDRAKSEFMSLASHQLRTPLTAIRWSLGRLERELQGIMNADASALFERGRNAIDRMAGTIDTMLRISQVEEKKIPTVLSDVNLTDLLSDKEKFFREQYAAKKLAFSVECPPSFMIRTDVTFLREILRNLIHNAIKYTPEGGRVIIRAHKDDTDAVLEVIDSGYGIPMHQQQNVFQKFFRGDNVINVDTTGTGLGLYLVSLLTKALGGSVAMHSLEGQGTTFILRLPYLNATAA